MYPRSKNHPRVHVLYRKCAYRPLLESLEDRLPPGDATGGMAAWQWWAGGDAAASLVGEMSPATETVSTQDVELLQAVVAAELAALQEQGEVVPAFEADVLASPFEEQGAVRDDGLDFWTPSVSDATPRVVTEEASHDGLGFSWSAGGSLDNLGAVGTPAATEQTQLLHAVDALALYAGLSVAPVVPTPTAPAAGQPADVLAEAPLSFEANVGQTDSQVDFLARGAGYTLFLTPTEAVFSLQQLSDAAASAVIRMEIVGANANAQASGQDEQSGTVNYFVGNDASQWHSDVAAFGRVEYQDVYPGIDLVYYGNAQNDLEYDFVVAPGADSGAIVLSYTGADRVELDAQGDLVLHLGDDQVRQHKPFTYQEVNGVRQEVASRYVLQGEQQVGFEIGAYDASLPLVIDPILVYSSFLGGNGIDLGRGISADPLNGLVVVTGLTTSANFPTFTPEQPTLRGAADAFVAQFNLFTGQRIYATYLGGTNLDEGQAVAIDPFYGSGYAWVAGTTSSTDFPTTPGAFQQTYRGGASDAYAVLLAPDGRIGFATYLGGNQDDEGLGLALDSGFQPYVTGSTTSANFPTTPGALQTAFGGGVDAFVTRLDFTLSTSTLSTFLGGEGDDFGLGIGVDLYSEIFVTGSTGSDTFPVTANAFQPVLAGLDDAFLIHLNSAGTPVFSTYFGGVDMDFGLSVAVDLYYGSGYSWITGATSSRNFPRVSASQSAYGGGGSDAFLASFNPTGAVLYSTYLGGSGDEQGVSTAIDANLYQYVTGATDSTNFPRVNASQNTYGGGDNDAFVTKVGYASERLYSTFLGGSNDDQGLGIAVDRYELAYVVGMTGSTNFPPESGLQPTYGGGQYDAFLSVLY